MFLQHILFDYVAAKSCSNCCFPYVKAAYLQFLTHQFFLLFSSFYLHEFCMVFSSKRTNVDPPSSQWWRCYWHSVLQNINCDVCRELRMTYSMVLISFFGCFLLPHQFPLPIDSSFGRNKYGDHRFESHNIQSSMTRRTFTRRLSNLRS